MPTCAEAARLPPLVENPWAVSATIEAGGLLIWARLSSDDEDTLEGSLALQDGTAGGLTESSRDQLIAVLGEKRYHADWTNTRHRARRLLSEFIGTFGLLFVLSAGAGAITAGAGAPVSKVTLVALLSATSALWIVAAVSALGDVSAHFNPATTFAFALRGDMHWYMAVAYWVVQFAAAGAGSLLARAFFGTYSKLAATMPPPGQEWQAVAFEALITGGQVMLVLSMAAGPKLNGPLIPYAVGAYIFSLGMTGGLFDGAAMNPARAFGPDLALGDFNALWVYVVGSIVGAAAAVLLDGVLRGRATAREAASAQSVALNESEESPDRP
ncbi:MAG: MIP/aquaporin family protein [Ktedonobacterales bacterium]